MVEKIKQVFESHELMRIGTKDLDGFVNVRSVDFAHDPQDVSKVYFTTFKATNKVQELAEDNRVYIVVDKPADTIEALSQIKYVRGHGKAYQVESPEEMQKAMGLLIGKYPFIQDLPGDPSMMSLYRIDIDRVKVTDNALGFGHVDTYDF